MKTISTLIKIFAIALGLLYTTQSHAQQIKDVFVLVDQSGTMNNSTINGEAKQIICDMITGQLNLNDWRGNGWNIVSAGGNFFNNTVPQMIKNGGKLCIVPFGNMERVYDSNIISYTDNSSAQQFIKGKFPTSFNDTYTYLNLAKAYTVHLAAENNISGRVVYMVIYTDGMGDYAKKNKYGDLQTIIDTYGTDEMSSLSKKKGVIRKSSSNRNYDIEVWELGPIPHKPDTTDEGVTHQKLMITSPKEGDCSANEVVWKKGEELNIKWKGSKGSITFNVQKKDSDKYSNIPNKNRSDYYKVNIEANSAKIKFFESGNYRIIVADSKGRDERYVCIKQPFPFFTILIIILAILGGVTAYRFFTKPKIVNTGGNGGQNNRREKSGSDDWD